MYSRGRVPSSPVWESWADTYDPDWRESQHCTDPPPPLATLPGGLFGNGQDVVEWNPVQGSGYVYGVWLSTNLQDGFHPLATNLADTVLRFTNTIVAPSVFYKIEAQ